MRPPHAGFGERVAKKLLWPRHAAPGIVRPPPGRNAPSETIALSQSLRRNSGERGCEPPGAGWHQGVHTPARRESAAETQGGAMRRFWTCAVGAAVVAVPALLGAMWWR